MKSDVLTDNDYWIAPNAISITPNALGDANRIQCGVASGAVIMCYKKDVVGYDVGHNYQKWPLTASPTFFNDDEPKYIHVAIPRSDSVGLQAMVVFPRQILDFYGKDGTWERPTTAKPEDEQIGSIDYYYVYLGVYLTAPSGGIRTLAGDFSTGILDTDEFYNNSDTTWWGQKLNSQNKVVGPLSGGISYIEFLNGVRIGVDEHERTLKVYVEPSSSSSSSSSSDDDDIANIYATGAVSALGQSPGGGGGGGSSYLRDLLDVEIIDTTVHPLSNGQSLVYNGTSHKWENQTIGGGGSGTLTSIGLVMPTGFSVSPAMLTADGSFTVGFSSGYSLPKTANVNKGVTAYGWGNHADVGYLTSVSFGDLTNHPDTLSGYGITDVGFISGGPDFVAIKLGSSSFNVLTAHQSLSNYYTKSEADTKFLTISFFSSLFKAYDSASTPNEIVPNGGDTSAITNIKAMFGFWTEQYLSALGKNGSVGSDTDIDAMWYALTIYDGDNTHKINSSYLPYTGGAGISIADTTISNSGVLSLAVNGNYLRVNTGGTNSDLTVPYATAASKLSDNATHKVWGQTFWTNGQPVSGNVSGNMTGVGSITASGNIETSGTVKATKFYLSNSIYFELDANNHVHLVGAGLYSDSFISALGLNDGSGGGSGSVIRIETGTGLTGGPITEEGTIAISSAYQTYISHGETAYGWGNHANAGYWKSSSHPSTIGGYGITDLGFVYTSGDIAYLRVGESSYGLLTGVTQGDGISISGTTISNSGVRAVTINGDYLRVNTGGTVADLTIPYATRAGYTNILRSNVMAAGDDYDTLSGYTATRGSFIAVNQESITTGITLDDLGAYDTLLSFGYSNRTIQFKGAGYSDTLKYRHVRTVPGSSPAQYGFSPWKTFAYIDSNVASATKLADNSTHKVWGQTFWTSGQPVSGDITGNISNTGSITPSSAGNYSIGTRSNYYNSIYARELQIIDGQGTEDFAINWRSNGDKRIVAMYAWETQMSDIIIGSTAVGSAMYYNASANRWGIKTDSPYSDFEVNGGVKAQKIYLYKPNSSNDIGAVYLTYGNDGVHVVGGGLYADTYVSALGMNGGGGTSFDESAMWLALGGTIDTQQISAIHLTTALAPYALKTDIPTLASLLWSYGSVTSSSGDSYNGSTVKTLTIPKATSHLTNDSGFVTSSALGSYLPLSGGTITGNLTVNGPNHQNLSVGSSAETSGIKWTGIQFVHTISGSVVSYGGIRIDEQNGSLRHYNSLYNIFTVWDSGNDGAGSGLDADMLDGTHKSDLFTSMTSTNATNLSITVGGTTMTIAGLYALRLKAVEVLSDNSYGDLDDLDGTSYSVITNYYTNTRWLNGPAWGSGEYGGSIIVRGLNNSLMGQLAWGAYHNEETAPTGHLWWRSRANKGFKSDWHQIAYTDGNVASATKLHDNTTHTVWGQTFWTNGQPAGGNVSGNMTGVGNLTMEGLFNLWEGSQHTHDFTIAWVNNVLRMYCYETTYWDMCIGTTTDTMAGVLYFDASELKWGIGTNTPTQKLDVNGAIKCNDLWIGNIHITYDSTNGGIHVINGGVSANTYVSSLGINADGSSGGGVDMSVVWANLAASTSEPIAYSHLESALTGYATQSWVASQNYLTSHQTIYGLTVKAGSTTVVSYTPNSSAKTLTLSAGNNITLSTSGSTITITGADTYVHPTNGANTTISSANGKVLSAITVNNLGHVTSVSSKTLAAADIPDLSASKITSGTLASARIPDLSDTYATTLRMAIVEGYFDASGKANNADKLDGYDSAYFATATGLTTANGNITTLQSYFTSGVANYAQRLAGTSSYSIFGNTYWSGGKPYGNITNAALSGVTTLTMSGDLYMNNACAIRIKDYDGNYRNIVQYTSGDVLSFGYGAMTQNNLTMIQGGNLSFVVASSLEAFSINQYGLCKVNAGSQGLQIGEARLIWDSDNNALKVTRYDGGTEQTCNLYATGGVSSLGMAVGSDLTVNELTVGNKLTFDNGEYSNYLQIDSNGNLSVNNAEGLLIDCDLYMYDNYIYAKRFYLDNSRYIYLDNSNVLKYYNGTTSKTIQLS